MKILTIIALTVDEMFKQKIKTELSFGNLFINMICLTECCQFIVRASNSILQQCYHKQINSDEQEETLVKYNIYTFVIIFIF